MSDNNGSVRRRLEEPKEKAISQYSFESRPSLLHLDEEQEKGIHNGVDGFINLFWTSLSMHLILTCLQQWRQQGHISLSWHLLRINYGDWWAFLMADCMAIAWTVTAWIAGRSRLLQFGCLSALMTSAITTVIWREWKPLQTGTFMAHILVLSMKMFSFASHSIQHGNGREDSLMAFIYFIVAPTLVYRPVYPRTVRIRWSYLADRTMGIVAMIVMLYLLIHTQILPVLSKVPHDCGRMEAIIALLLPFTLAYLIIFFLVFEYILNWFAEVSRFADRHFYADWWNSRSFGDFARKWNRPVHTFLLHHLHQPLLLHLRRSKREAMLITFLASSILHELVMSLMVRRLVGHFLWLQMLQVPLIELANWSQIARRSPRLGNILFWMSLNIGVPLIAIIYCCEYKRAQ